MKKNEIKIFIRRLHLSEFLHCPCEKYLITKYNEKTTYH